MSSGSSGTIAVSTSPFYYQHPPGGLEYQGSARFLNGSTKTWNGGDRVVLVKPKRSRVKRYYYTLRTRTFVNKRGRLVTKTYRIRRSFTVLSKPRPQKSSSVPNAYSMRYERRLETPMDGYDSVANRYLLGISPIAFGALPTFDDMSFTANDNIRLINKLSEQVRGSDFNAAVFLAEGGKALEMIGNAAIKLASGLRYVKQGNLVAALQAFTGKKSAVKGHGAQHGYAKSKSIEKTLLESSYGWQPLLKDIHGGAEMLANIVHSSMTKRYQVRTSKRCPINMDYPPVPVNDSAICVSRKQIVAYITKPENLLDQLSFTDPASLAWELLPASFLWDWIMPIGSFLAANAFSRSSLKGTFVTTSTVKIKVRGLKTRSNNVFYSGAFEYDLVTQTRTVSSTLLVPFPEFVPLNKILSWKRAANAVALISVLRPISTISKAVKLRSITTI